MAMFEKKLAILIFHRVLDRPDPLRPYDPDIRLFEQQIAQLTRWWNVLPLQEAIASLRDGSLPARAVSITFDDGYEDNFRNAVPILKKHSAPATVFVATGFLDGGIMFNDLVTEAVRNSRKDAITVSDEADAIPLGNSSAERLDALGKVLGQIKYRGMDERETLARRIAAEHGYDPGSGPMMTSQQVRDTRQSGMEVGAHTERHPILREVSGEVAKREIEVGKSTLESILQEEVQGFAYPNGKSARDFDQRDVDVVRTAGFDYAVTTDWSAARSSSDLYRLPRLSLGGSAIKNLSIVAKAKLKP